MGLGKAKENFDDVARAGSTSLSSSYSASKELGDTISGPISSPAPKGESANLYILLSIASNVHLSMSAIMFSYKWVICILSL